MPQAEFDIYEKEALTAAGDKAGQMLDKIGKTDLAELTPQEWSAFCRTMVTTFGDALAKRLQSFEPPF